MSNSTNRSRDRHRHSFMVRLPEIFRGKLRVLGQRLHKPMTGLVKLALTRLLASAGLWSPKDDQELEQQERSLENHGHTPGDPAPNSNAGPFPNPA